MKTFSTMVTKYVESKYYENGDAFMERDNVF